MFAPLTLLVVVLSYMGILFLVAYGAEHSSGLGKRLTNHGVVYSLSLAIYCTSWTYYGSVGMAVSSGMLFVTLYLGPTLGAIFWGNTLRKLVRIKNLQRITSVADFISARYQKSQSLAALVTIISLVGMAPYLALQITSIGTTFNILAESTNEGSVLCGNIGFFVVIFMILFTIVFGARRIDPTERHQGMVLAVAVESLVKLLTLLAVGIFVVYYLSANSSDEAQRSAMFAARSILPSKSASPPSTWLTSLCLSMSAALFLPRQFHIAVVENSHEENIRTATWLFPLYMLLISFFIYPIALRGLELGLPANQADTFVLTLPLRFGAPVLALFVFIGGFSAATSMIMIEAMTMATMITNHIFLPIVTWVSPLGFLQRRLLHLRWVAIAIVILVGYWFELKLAGSLMLGNMGMISFAAALQLAPSIIGGLYWRRGKQAGAMSGLFIGFSIWFYTLLLPSFAKAGWISTSIVTDGPWGLNLLRPEELFGLHGVDTITNSVFWSMAFNIGAYILGSLLGQEPVVDEKQEDLFVDAFRQPGKPRSGVLREPCVDFQVKNAVLLRLLQQYFSTEEAQALINRCTVVLGLRGPDKITILEFAEIVRHLEKMLAGAIGAAAAAKVFRNKGIFSATEHQELTEEYGRILASLKVSPGELRQKIDYHQDREKLLAVHAAELEAKVEELEEQIRQRKHAELLFDSVVDAILVVDLEQRIINCNHNGVDRVFGYSKDDLLGKTIELLYVGGNLHTGHNLIRQVVKYGHFEMETSLKRKDGSTFESFITASLLSDVAGQPIGIIEIVRDITEAKETEEHLRRQATYDHTTELFNRRYVMEKLKDEVESAVRYHYPLSLCLCDVDHFKSINDHHGHMAGDKVLLKLGDILRSELRRGDIAGRYGGDEILILFPHTAAEKAAVVLERIREIFKTTLFSGENHTTFSVSATFGIAELSSSDKTADDFFERADAALYSAKRRGRDAVVTGEHPVVPPREIDHN